MASDVWTTLGNTVISGIIAALVSYIYNSKLEKRKADLARTNKQDELVTQASLTSQLDTVKGAAVALASGYTASNERRLECIKALWGQILDMRKFAADILYIYDVFPHGPYPQDKQQHILDTLPKLSPSAWLADFLNVVKDAERYRPFVGEHMWQQYAVYRGFLGRAGVKMLSARDSLTIPTWHDALLDIDQQEEALAVGFDDEPLTQALRIVLEEDELNDCKCTQHSLGAPRRVLTTIEGKMMHCINAWVMGDMLVEKDEALRQKMRQHNDPDILKNGRNAILTLRQSAERATLTPID